jgi:hypothetical protein
MSDIRVRVGQQNSVKVISSVSGGSIFAENAGNSINVSGGIASVTQLSVSGVSTFVGLATFRNDVYIDGDLYIRDDLTFDEFTARNANITGTLKISNALGVAYFNSLGQIVSTGSTSSAINYTNYILTTNNAGITTWSSTIDGGEY